MAVPVPVFERPIWVKPGSRHTVVGGAYREPPALVVRVAAPAAQGAANQAVRAALAKALGVRTSQIEIVRGHHHRAKTIRVVHAPEDLAGRWDALLSTVV